MHFYCNINSNSYKILIQDCLLKESFLSGNEQGSTSKICRNECIHRETFMITKGKIYLYLGA
jgi:hypothetical protein